MKLFLKVLQNKHIVRYKHVGAIHSVLKPDGGSRITKKKIRRVAGFALLALMLAVNIPVFAQENEEKPVDVMDMSLEELLNVEITTASKKPEKVGEIPASIVIVTRADIENYGYQSLAEVLENIPGLYQTDDYLNQNFGVRGFWTAIPQRNFIILVNGVPQTEWLNTGNQLQQINLPVEAIDRIEVVRGPMAVMYGTGAFFGVINIKTNIVESYNPINLVSASFGSEMTHKLFARSSGKQLDFHYAFNASYFHTDGLDVPYTDIGNPDILANWGVPIGGRTRGQLKNTEKYFNFSGQFKDFSIDSSFTEADKHTIGGLPSIKDGTLQFNRALRITFGYKKEFSDKIKMDARFGYFVNRIVYDYKWLKPDFVGVENDESRAYTAEANLFFFPSRKLDITVGLNYRKILGIKNEATVPDLGVTLWSFSLDEGEAIITHAFFTQWNYHLSRRLKIVAGVRLEQSPVYTLQFKQVDLVNNIYATQTTPSSEEKARIQFIPRLALIYNFDGRNVIKLLYGKAINQPSFSQLAENVYFITPDPDDPESKTTAKPTTEDIQTLELNYVGQYSPELIVSASVFRNMLDSLIIRALTVVNKKVYISKYANVGKMDTTGVEVTVQAMPMEQLSFELSATYQDTVDERHKGEDAGYSPKFLGYFKLAYIVQQNITLALIGNYVGPMISSYDETQDPAIRLGGENEAAGYFLLGANLKIKKLFGTDMFLNLRGSNLLDQKIHYPTTANNSNFATKGTVGRGISFLLTLGWKF